MYRPLHNRWFRFSLLAFALIPLLVACYGSGQAASNASAAQPTIAVYAFNSEPVLDWDPSVEFSNGIVVLNNVYETLLRYNPLTDKFDNILATSYSKSADSLSWTFKIRKGVKFHDGTDLNAKAVKFSIDRTIKLGKGAAYIWDPVKNIKVVDDDTVQFDLKYPAPLDLISSSGYAAFIMSPKAAQAHKDNWFSQGNEAGTGPYMLKNQTQGQEVVLQKFKDYWKGWKGKHFDFVDIKKVPETASRRQMVEKGDADFALELPYEDVNSLKKNSNVQVFQGPSFQNLMFFMNTKKKPLDNKLVRQAISYAFPYQDVVKYAMGNYATQSTGVIPKGLWGHGKDLAQYTNNIDKAKKLLTQAGYANGGFSLTMTYMSGDEAEKKSAELFKAQLEKLHINLDIRSMPWDSQWEMSKSTDPSKRQDILAMYWWPDYASPYSWLKNLLHGEDTPMYNLSYWKNAGFDQQIDKANADSGIDRKKAEQEFIDAQKIAVDEAPVIYAYDKKDVYVLNKNFKGYQDNPIYPNVVFFYNTYRK